MEIQQDYKGLWTVEVKDADGRIIMIVKKTTKKALQNWIKEYTANQQ